MWWIKWQIALGIIGIKMITKNDPLMSCSIKKTDGMNAEQQKSLELLHEGHRK